MSRAAARDVQRPGPFRRAGRIAAALGLAALAACDPCAGVLGCDVSPQLAYTGQVIHHDTRAPASGVRVEFVAAQGEALAGIVASGTTNGEGRWSFSVPVDGAGTVRGTLRLSGGGLAEEQVLDSVELRTVALRGDARAFPLLAAEPFQDGVWQLRRRGSGEVLAGADAVWARTGGVPATPDSVRGPSDATGLWLIRLTSARAGAVLGELRVRPAGSDQVFTTAVTTETQLYDRMTVFLGEVRVGPQLPYLGRLVWNDSVNSPAGGVQVTLRRTGGVPASAPQVVVTTNADGYFALHGLVPLQAGVLAADLVAQAPGRAPVTFPGVQIPAVERDEIEILHTWSLVRG
jgi:hypothetical protein